MILMCLDCGSVQEQDHRTSEDTCKSCGSRRVRDYCEHADAEYDYSALHQGQTGLYIEGHCPDCDANLRKMFSFVGILDVDNDVTLTAEGGIP